MKHKGSFYDAVKKLLASFQNQDRSSARGVFYMKVERNGVVVDEFTKENLIIDLGKNAQARLLGGDVTNRSITKIGFGTNGTAATLADTALTGSFVKAVSSVSYPENNTVQFNWQLNKPEAVGLAIREIGLITNGNVLFSRLTRDVFNKTDDIQLSGFYKIIY